MWTERPSVVNGETQIPHLGSHRDFLSVNVHAEFSRGGGAPLVRWSKNPSASYLVGDTFRPSLGMVRTAQATAVSASLCVSYHPRPPARTKVSSA
jgi:hypothetical protein